MPAPPFVPGTILGGYRLIEPGAARSGVSWTAERIDSGETVSLRIFPRSLPPDESKRAALLDAIGSKLPIDHPSIASIREASAHEDALLIETAHVAGGTLAAHHGALDAAELVPLTASLVAGLDTLHSKGIVHGTLTPERVLNVDGRWVIAEVNPSALLGRPDRGESRLLAATDPGAAAELRWRAPEQLSGQPLTRRSDIFSLGAILYRAATGAEPFPGESPEVVTTAILRSAVRSPKELNPELSPALVSIIGACLRKDPTKRPQTASVLMDELARIDAGARSFLARPSGAPSKDVVFLVAELPYIELLERSQPRKAMRNSAKMQQFVSEAVLLVDGEVLDSLGNRMIATLPTADAALSAIRQAVDTIAEHNVAAAADDIIEPAMLVHRGAIVIEASGARGPELAIAQRVIPSLEPGQILISAPVIRETALSGQLPRAGSIEGIEFHLLSTPPLSQPAAPPPVAPGSSMASAPETLPPPASRRFPAAAWGAIAILSLAILGTAAFFLLRGGGEKELPIASSALPADAAGTSVDPRPSLFLGSFAEGIEEPGRAAGARAIGAALRRIIASVPELRLVDQPTPGAAQYGARLAEGGASLIAFSAAGDGPEVKLDNAGAATAELAAWILGQTGAAAPGGTAEAIGAFVEALRELEAGSRDRALGALRRSTSSDPEFLAAQELAFELFSESEDVVSAIPAAEAILRRRPSDHPLRATLFGWYRERREIPSAIRHATVLSKQEAPAEALGFLAAHALSAGDEDAFGAILPRLGEIHGATSPHHPPDLLAAQGRFAAAAQQYYVFEPNEPENPWLAFKIGRIAVIRHSTAVTEMELDKLARLEPRYLHPLLEAYLAAERRNRPAVAAALERAAAHTGPDDAFHTSSAEIYAILADHRQILASLRRAYEAHEPTLTSVLTNPLFAYLSDDRQYAPLQAEMLQRREEIRAALAPLR